MFLVTRLETIHVRQMSSMNGTSQPDTSYSLTLNVCIGLRVRIDMEDIDIHQKFLFKGYCEKSIYTSIN